SRVLQLAAVTYGHADVDIDALADDAPLANACPLADLRLVPDQGAVTDRSFGGHVGGGLDWRGPPRRRGWSGRVEISRSQHTLPACRYSEARPSPCSTRSPTTADLRSSKGRREPPMASDRTVRLVRRPTAHAWVTSPVTDTTGRHGRSTRMRSLLGATLTRA